MPSAKARHGPHGLAVLALLCGCTLPPPAPIVARPPPMPPIGVEAGNLWPGPAARVPTMLDLQAEGVHASTLPARHRGGAWLCRVTAGQAPEGVALGLCH